MIDWWKRYLQFNVTAKLTMLASVAMSWRCATVYESENLQRNSLHLYL